MPEGVNSTPYRPTQYSNHVGMRAGPKQADCDEEIVAYVEDAYIANVKSDLELSHAGLWDAIVASDDVKAAHGGFRGIAVDNEKRHYFPATVLLNEISLAYATNTNPSTSPDDRVVLYLSPSDHLLTGDYLCIRSKPDFFATVATRNELEAWLAAARVKLTTALSQDNKGPLQAPDSPPLQAWPQGIGAGEGKPRDSKSAGQFKYYMAALKRYRPDLDTVHGFQINRGQVYLSTMSPGGLVTSEKEDRSVLSAWIAHIALLYQADSKRDTRFSLPTPTPHFTRYTATLSGKSLSLAPIYVSSRCPGRCTWAAFEVPNPADDPTSYAGKPSTGFLKTSYQDASKKKKETQYLDIAHEGTWLPGLVRHWPVSQVRRVIPETGQEYIKREKEIIHLASLGDPLSRCTSALHLLKVIYDAIETHFRLYRDRRVLHRDLSWFNILCNPWHDPKTTPEGGKSVQEGVPCIEQILTGDVAKEPCALLVDLDHSAEYKCGERIATGARVRTGTPMFMACELSSSSRDAALDYPRSSIVHLESQLEAVENLGDVFRRAFPDDDGTFMKQFRLVLEAEEQRRKTNGKAFTNPKTPHLPRHDVESVFWVLVWCFARACPVGAPFEDARNGEFSNWAHNMLKHTIGNESARWTLLGSAQILKTILHPDLASFSELLEDIAAYLIVPWDLYHDIVDDDHVHIAIRRLLLAQIHALNNNPTLDVKLNTLQPRVINLRSHTDYVSQPSRDYVSPWASAATGPSSLASTMAVQTGSEASAAPDLTKSVHHGSGASAGRSKRSAPDDDASSSTSNPKKKTTSKKKRNAKAQDGPDAQSTPYSKLSAAARCENLWDSWLWFAIGRRGKAAADELESRPSAA
ncbi:hypothetical protein EXIGLDRAFT_773448 [Exidia glandulosa HHB12029]|uniref:Fungal-type protein kinase domain-containing protein n=1 Tax=Exidia glandulosa HHB12029 TaxID=1314781 RepID=A0A165ETL6_EXIGL|nr:hypothetical protein EXIGLDRAFT_773448 [Exidia glandulosa HHB12029]